MKIFNRDLSDYSEDYMDKFKKILSDLGIEKVYKQIIELDAALQKAGISSKGRMENIPVKDIQEYPKITLEPKVTALSAKHEERGFFIDILLEHHDARVKNKIMLTNEDYRDLLIVGELAEKHRLRLASDDAELYEKLKNDPRCSNCNKECCYNREDFEDKCDYYGTHVKRELKPKKQAVYKEVIADRGGGGGGVVIE